MQIDLDIGQPTWDLALMARPAALQQDWNYGEAVTRLGGRVIRAGLVDEGVLVGLALYLPFSITLTYGLGCVASIWLKEKKGERWMGDTLVPIAAGFIIGEALTSLGVVLYSLAAG